MVLELLFCPMPFWLREGFLGMPSFRIAGNTCTWKGPGFSGEGCFLPELDHGLLQANRPLSLLADQAAEDRDNSGYSSFSVAL